MKKWTYESPLGLLIMLSDRDVLKGLWFSDQKYFGGSFDLEKVPEELNEFHRKIIGWLDAYFAGKNPNAADINVSPEVTEFREAVLEQMAHIPYGQVSTYKDLYEDLNRHTQRPIGSVRSVGGAVGHNPISIIIPCHRVIGSDGSLTGYAGGIERKKALLKLEGY